MSIENKVAGMAVRLDLHDPDWYQKIEPYRLDLLSNSHCVLGQVYGNYGAKEARQFRKKWVRTWRLYVIPHPFLYFWTSSRHRAEDAWTNEINKRQVRRYDERARFLHKREWVTQVQADEKVEAFSSN